MTNICRTFTPRINNIGKCIAVEPIPADLPQTVLDDDVEQCGPIRNRRPNFDSTKLGTLQVADVLGRLMPGKKVEHLGRSELSIPGGARGTSCLFFQALHAAFDGHHAFTLRPEVLMHLVVCEVATVVNLHSDHYRALFTSSAERQVVRVRHDGLRLGEPESPWHEAIALFEGKLADVVPPGIMEHMLPGFTTGTTESRVAGLVAFMDAAQQFYDFRVETRCGIPEIRLAGTAEDWRRLQNAVAQLAEPFRAHLGRYFDGLLPVLKTIADQAAGAPMDETFWASIYKYNSDSGTAKFNGWITAFVNYIQTAQVPGSQYKQAEPGRLLQKPDNLYDWTSLSTDQWSFEGLDSGCVPSHVASAPFIWEYMGTNIPMRFAAGVLGVDNENGSIMPRLSYAVVHNK